MFENLKIAASLEALLKARPEFTQVVVTEVLKGGEKNHVCFADIDGRSVVVKRFLQEGAPQTVLSLQAELDFVAVYLAGERNRINECLFAFPEDGIVILSVAPGARLGAALMTAKGQERALLMQHSGEWLAQYTAPRRREGSFSPRHWLRRLDVLGSCQGADQSLLDALRHSLVSQTKHVQGAPVTHAATHGDYVSLNAHYHDGVIYGVDIQGESWLPLTKDIAGFLVWEGLRRGTQTEDLWLGVARQDIEGFLLGVELPVEEQMTVLPFMIGLQFYQRVVERSNAQKSMDHIRQSVDNYISSAAALGSS